MTDYANKFNAGVIGPNRRKSALVSLDDFLSNDADGTGSYTLHKGGFGAGAAFETITSAVTKPGSSLMFEDFAAMVTDQDSIEKSMQVSERTQMLLDAAWKAGLESERG